MKQIIGFCGLAGAGKSTAAMLLSDDSTTTISFADTLKDVVAIIFSWDRNMVEGNTKQSREWREAVDPFWSAKLGIADFTPRKALTMIGTDTLRRHFNSNIWVHSLEKKVLDAQTNTVLIPDLRFSNEFELLRNMGGRIIEIKPKLFPEWYSFAYNIKCPVERQKMMAAQHPNVHQSEYNWITECVDYSTVNDGTRRDLLGKLYNYLI